jgi:hypothetical protein
LLHLEPTHDGKVFWDLSVLDPIVIDFMEPATGHYCSHEHLVVTNISTILHRMFPKRRDDRH